MTDRIVLDMVPGEAIMALGVLTEHAAQGYRTWARLMETNAPEDEQEAVKVATDTVNRVAVRLANLLYPPCEALVDPECPRGATVGGLCAFHAARRVAVVA